MDYIREARNLFPLNNKQSIHYDRPFPIGVFGTLRKLPRPCGNSHLMDGFTHPPLHTLRGFLPHFIPNGLSLDFCPGASGAFEVFWYAPEHFDEVIAPIDRLESFVPDRKKPHWYERTLVEMKIIPDNYRELGGPWADLIDNVFNEGLNMQNRDIGIPKEEWEFSCCPVWVYSNPPTNDECMEIFSEKDGDVFFEGGPSRSVYKNPILWRGIETNEV